MNRIASTADRPDRSSRSDESPLARSLRLRHAARLRCEPMADGRLDVLDLPGQRMPSTFGLDTAGVRAEAERCWRDLGFFEWECLARFDLGKAA